MEILNNQIAKAEQELVNTFKVIEKKYGVDKILKGNQVAEILEKYGKDYLAAMEANELPLSELPLFIFQNNYIRVNNYRPDEEDFELVIPWYINLIALGGINEGIIYYDPEIIRLYVKLKQHEQKLEGISADYFFVFNALYDFGNDYPELRDRFIMQAHQLKQAYNTTL